ncbi:retrovirus-related pol polyprotein from transposon TNT 1-94 [Tanacetum coccineum]
MENTNLQSLRLAQDYKPNMTVDVVSRQDDPSSKDKQVQDVTHLNTPPNDHILARMDQLQNQLNQMLMMMLNNQKGSFHGIFSSSNITIPKLIASLVTDFIYAWIIDSGATDHISTKLTFMIDIQTFSIPIIKYLVDGTVERYKVRLAAKGYTQKEEIDFKETFAPLAKMVTDRALLALAVHNNWQLKQLDVNNAYIHGDLHDEVYIALPQGYYTFLPPNIIYKLNKSLYSLKQESKQWFNKLTEFLLSLNFQQSYADTSLYIHLLS